MVKLLRGNWLGALLVALIPMLVSLVLSVGLAAALQHDRSRTGWIIKGGIAQAFASLGSPMRVSGGSGATVLAPALLITFVAFGVAAVAFRTITRRYPNRAAVLGDGLRASAIFAFLMMIASIVVHVIKPEFDGFQFQSFGSDAPGSVMAIGSHHDYHLVPSLSGATFFPALILLATLTISALRLRIPGETGFFARLHAITVTPLTGIALLVWATVPASGVFVGSIYLHKGHEFEFRELAQQISSLPNYGVHTFALGLGGRFGQWDGHDRYLVHLNKLANHNDGLHWLMWFSIPVVVLALLIAAVLVVARSDRQNALWAALVYLALLPAALPILGFLANYNAWYEEDGKNHHIVVGATLSQLTWYGWGAALVVIGLLLLITGKFRINGLQHVPGQAYPAPPYGAPQYAVPQYGTQPGGPYGGQYAPAPAPPYGAPPVVYPPPPAPVAPPVPTVDPLTAPLHDLTRPITPPDQREPMPDDESE